LFIILIRYKHNTVIKPQCENYIIKLHYETDTKKITEYNIK